MSRFVVDACVAIKWVVAEEHSIAALRFAQNDPEMYMPELVFSGSRQRSVEKGRARAVGY